MSEYFDMKSDKWKTTVKWCLRMGVALGLIIGGGKYYIKYCNLFKTHSLYYMIYSYHEFNSIKIKHLSPE